MDISGEYPDIRSCRFLQPHDGRCEAVSPPSEASLSRPLWASPWRKRRKKLRRGKRERERERERVLERERKREIERGRERERVRDRRRNNLGKSSFSTMHT